MDNFVEHDRACLQDRASTCHYIVPAFHVRLLVRPLDEVNQSLHTAGGWLLWSFVFFFHYVSEFSVLFKTGPGKLPSCKESSTSRAGNNKECVCLWALLSQVLWLCYSHPLIGLISVFQVRVPSATGASRRLWHVGFPKADAIRLDPGPLWSSYSSSLCSPFFQPPSSLSSSRRMSTDDEARAPPQVCGETPADLRKENRVCKIKYTFHDELKTR